MLKEQISFVRNLFGKSPMRLFSDNAKITDTRADMTHVIWDDTNEMCHVIKPNTTDFYNNSKPALLESFCYNEIQYVSSGMDLETLKTVLNTLKSKGILSDEQYNKIIDDYKK